MTRIYGYGALSHARFARVGASLLLHVIIYLSPKCLKRVEKVKKTDFFKKQGFRQCWTKVLGIVLEYSYFSVISRFFLKTVQRFLKFCCSSLSPTLYKVETRKEILDTRVQHVIFCRRTLHLCNRFPFRLLVKSFSAVSERDIMIVKLLLYFLCVCMCFSVFFMVSICFLFRFFVCLSVCCCFCFLFLLKNSLLLRAVPRKYQLDVEIVKK